MTLPEQLMQGLCPSEEQKISLARVIAKMAEIYPEKRDILSDIEIGVYLALSVIAEQFREAHERGLGNGAS